MQPEPPPRSRSLSTPHERQRLLLPRNPTEQMNNYSGKIKKLYPEKRAGVSLVSGSRRGKEGGDQFPPRGEATSTRPEDDTAALSRSVGNVFMCKINTAALVPFEIAAPVEGRRG